MAKIRNNYEKSWFPRLLKWLDGGSGLLDDAMAHELDEGSEEHLLPDSQDALTRETKFEQHRQESLDKDETLYERYHQWAHTRGKKLLTWLYRLLAVVVCFSIIWVLLQTASYLPPFGNPDNPVNNEVSQRYIEKGMEETGAVNIVAGMILDYRAFDTLGESNVLFIAACSVLILLRVSGSKDGKPSTEQLEAEADDRMYEPKNDAILQHAANFLVPLILMFGVYVILNGHISPGGGFSGGAIMGAGLILYLNAFGFKFLHFHDVQDCVLRRAVVLCVEQGVQLLHRREPSAVHHHNGYARHDFLRRADSVPEHRRRTGRLLHDVRLLYAFQKGGHVSHEFYELRRNGCHDSFRHRLHDAAAAQEHD